MRVLIVGSVLRPDWTGGEPRLGRSIADGLRDRGVTVVVDARPRRGVYLLATAVTPWDWDVLAVESYRRSIRAARPDVVLCFYDYDTSIQRAAMVERVPSVTAVHIHWPICPIGTLYLEGQGICSGAGLGKCLAHMDRRIPDTRLPGNLTRLPPPFGAAVYAKFRARPRSLSTSRFLIAPSESMERLLAASGYENVRVIPNGIDLSEFAPSTSVSDPPEVLLVAATSSERKGLRDFCAMADRVRARRPDVVFTATNFEGNPSVRGTSRLTRAELIARMRSAYLLVVPSLWSEPFGMVSLEGMAAGRPVVAYDVGAAREILGDGGGILVPRGDIDGLAASALTLLADPEQARRVGQAGRRRVQSVYGLEPMVDRYLRCLHDALASQPRAVRE